MPKTPDFNVAIQAIVAEEVRARLAPYLAMLAQLARLVEHVSVRRPPEAPPQPKAVVAPLRRPSRVEIERAKTFSVGQIVHYRQGRGTLNAQVVAIEAETGFLSLERLKDGKRQIRPASKVKPGEAPVLPEEPQEAPTAPRAVAAVKPFIRRRARPADEPITNGAQGAEGLAGADVEGAAEQRPESLAARFAAGQMVRYRRGWDTIEARVVEFDSEKGMLKVVQLHDGQMVMLSAAEAFVAA